MNKTRGFANVPIILEEGMVFQVMFLHKHFIFVEMGKGNVSVIPLSQKEEEELIKYNMDQLNEVTDLNIIETLNSMLDGRNAEEELKKRIL